MPPPVGREATPQTPRAHVRKRHVGPRRAPSTTRRAVSAVFTTLPALATAQADGRCISLQGSQACPAFQSASISTNNALIQTYPFLQFVSDSASFDYQLATYVETSYVKDKYQNVLGCRGINFTDSSNMYARYTVTVLCNTLVQQSINGCGLSRVASRPVCADTCAEFAQSEAYVTADKDLCSNPSPDLIKLIRADFATCSLPDGALAGGCISGFENESENCGFANSILGLCSYCAAGGINSTDTCCYNANAERRCDGVKLPSIIPTMTFSTPTATATPTAGEGDEHGGRRRLSGGAIAGIVMGSLAGVALLALLLFLCMRAMGRKGGSQEGSIFNQPSPARRGPPMAQPKQMMPEGYEVLPGGRVARMSALEGHSSNSPTSRNQGGVPAAAAAAAAAGFMAGGRSKDGGDSPPSSDEYGDSPESDTRGVLRPPPASRRHGSLSSGSVLASEAPRSPTSGGEHSSPVGVASQNSEQLPFFRDYYSQDDIHPADRVAVLWAYQPRAADEFALERGDMLKVVGIWDDGWATGAMLDERADEWEARRQAQRDSGVSNTLEPRDNSPPSSPREIKAFPLVCVCLPEHWRKTIEGDGSTETASTGAANAPSNGL